MELTVTVAHRGFRLGVEAGNGSYFILLIVVCLLFSKLSCDLDRNPLIRLIKNYLRLQLYSHHSAEAVLFYLNLIVSLLGISGPRPAFIFALALFTHDEEDRTGYSKHQC